MTKEGSAISAQPPGPQDVYRRLVLWNIGLTLVDAARVDRAAYAEAFRATTGRPLVRLPQMAGRTDSEMQRDLVAYEGKTYDPDRFLRPATVGLLVAQAVNAPRDGHIHELTVRPNP